MKRTGMFLPYSVEKPFARDREEKGLGIGKAVTILLVLLVVIVGSGFILRAYTVRHLPSDKIENVDAIAITQEDLIAARDLLPAVLKDPVVASKLNPVQISGSHRLLAYFIPIDYVMQGMIADTGGEWKLFEHHKTLGMITEYIFHPFAHLTGGHSHHTGMHADHSNMHDSPAMKRRIIFIEISATDGELKSPSDDFDINMKRTPIFFVDVHLHTGEILQVQNTTPGSGWGTVPTPMF